MRGVPTASRIARRMVPRSWSTLSATGTKQDRRLERSILGIRPIPPERFYYAARRLYIGYLIELRRALSIGCGSKTPSKVLITALTFF